MTWLQTKVRKFWQQEDVQALWAVLQQQGLFAAGGFLLARSVIFDAYAPFGVAFLAAQNGKKRMFATFLGVVLGYITVMKRVGSIQYLMSCVLILLVSRILRKYLPGHRRQFAAGATAISLGLMGFAWYLSVLQDGLTAALWLAEVVLGTVSVYIFYTAADKRTLYDPEAAERRLICRLTVVALAGISMPMFPLFGFTFAVGRVLSLTAVLASANASGMYGGILMGLIAGLAADLGASAAPMYTAIYALCGMAAGFAAGKGKNISATVFGASVLLLAAFLPGENGVRGAIAELAPAVGLYLLLPDRLWGTLPKAHQTIRGDETRLRQYLRERLQRYAAAYADVADSVMPQGEAPKPDIQPELYRSLTCQDCLSCGQCTKDIAAGGLNSKAILRRGRALPADYCQAIRDRCTQLDAVCQDLTEEVREQRRKTVSDNLARETQRSIADQYGRLSSLISRSAEDLTREINFESQREAQLSQIFAKTGCRIQPSVFRDSHNRLHVELVGEDCLCVGERLPDLRERLSAMLGTEMELPEQTASKYFTGLSFVETAPYTCRVGAGAEKKNGEVASGDCGTYFRGKDGCLYVILSDGMGSGILAREEAVRTIRLTESFLRAGIAPEQALEIICTAVRRNTPEMVFATVDVAVIDPVGCTLSTYKLGAAPTYIRTTLAPGKYRVTALGGENCARMDCITTQTALLENGDMILMASDGVGGVPQRSDMKACLGKLVCDEPRELAEILIKMTRTETDCDDRTVIAISFEKQNTKNSGGPSASFLKKAE